MYSRNCSGHLIEPGGLFEVSVLSQKADGPKQDNTLVTLSWTDDDGNDWKLCPVLLHVRVKPSKEKQFMFLQVHSLLTDDTMTGSFYRSVPAGIDIHDSVGESLGNRKPITLRNTKSKTLPIASIVLSMSERDNLSILLAYREKAVGIILQDMWSGSGAGARTWAEAYSFIHNVWLVALS